MAHLWQHPFVNVFKHFNVATWKKSTKEGEVVATMDKTLKCTVYKITGSIPAGNYIQIPKVNTQSLGLTGRYFYLLFKPVPTKFFVVHIDVATQDSLVVRVSFSNLFKEFKSTATWLQFPFVCHAAKGSIPGFAAVGAKDQSGPAPVTTRWTVLCLDFHYILSMYLNRKFAYIKSLRLCANMSVKNVFTSDICYDPGISMEEAKKRGLLDHGISPMPRELSFPVYKGDLWHDHYDMISFPSEGNKKPFDSAQHSEGPLATKSADHHASPRRVEARTVDVSKCVSDRVSMIHKLTAPKEKRRKKVTKEIPEFGEDVTIQHDKDPERHVFAQPDRKVTEYRDRNLPATTKTIKTKDVESRYVVQEQPTYKSLTPDPIMKLKRIIGFGGASFRDVLWSADGSSVVYPCHAVVVSMKVTNGHQRFFIGHTDKVSCLTMPADSQLLASGQTGTVSVVRVWGYAGGECLAMAKTHTHSLHTLSFAHKGTVLCGVGKDGQGKNMVVIWDTSRVQKRREMTVMAKAHTDVDIVKMIVAPFDDTRLVSCGRDNIRLWRVRDGSLRSAPVSMGEYHVMEFTDVCFEAGYLATRDPEERLVYACTRAGYIFEVDYKKVAIQHVRRLLPVHKNADKQHFKSAAGIPINAMCINETFCVTGSEDGYLRLWPLDFSHVYLEAEHEGAVAAVSFSGDGLKILAGTSTGSLGILDMATRGYTTIMRSHTSLVSSVAIDPYRKHLASVSADHTIRVWDAESLQQLYDFSAPKESPCAISYHPTRQMFACGFENGIVRVFNVQSTTMLAEHKQHRGNITGLVYSPNGDHLYSSCAMGTVSIYDATSESYGVIRVLGNTSARGKRFGPDAIAVSSNGRKVAFVGPSDFVVTVVDGKCLDEILRIDISTLSGSSRGTLDTAEKVTFAPGHLGHLLVTTTNNRLLKFDAQTGRIVAEVDHIHRSGCSSLVVSQDGRYLATAGDRVVKIWDYHMKLDINFQVFIGHSEVIHKVLFTPDGLGFLSAGEAIYLWDFLAHRPPTPPLEGRQIENESHLEDRSNLPLLSRTMGGSYTDILHEPPRRPPSPAHIDDLSSIHKVSNGDEETASLLSAQEMSKLPQEVLAERSKSYSEVVKDVTSGSLGGGSRVVQSYRHIASPARRVPVSSGQATSSLTETRAPPTAQKHFQRREKTHELAQRRYTAPPNQAGIQLKTVIGYNGNGRGNMVWNPDTGLFVYTCGCMVVVEDLNTGAQSHLQGHVEEVSTLAVQNNGQVLASASGAFGVSPSQICVWDLEEHLCRKVLNHHKFDIVCLAYSRDDRFLISVGDYRECSIVVWSADSYEVLTKTTTSQPVHEVSWDPFTVNEFASVGQSGCLLFWLLDETTADVTLNVHEATAPEELKQTHHVGARPVDFTAMAYAGDSTLYVATSAGQVSAWDTRRNSCFLHWEADTAEIDVLLTEGGRLITGSVGRGSLRLWEVEGMGGLRHSGDQGGEGKGIAMEDEMNLDGGIVSAAFDEALHMGIVGTSSGTLWYINWSERASIRLVSGHMSKVNSLVMVNDSLLASCADDGSLRLWSIANKEQALQFQVLEQSCTCVTVAPVRSDGTAGYVSSAGGSITSHSQRTSASTTHVAAGYSDGTVRMFDIARVEMILKMHPHAVAVTAIAFSADGRMIISGASDGLIAVSSPTTGMTVRVINDHKGAPITNIDVTFTQEQDLTISAPLLWLACSADRRVSVWSADWTKDYCELIDWLSFPAPAIGADGGVVSKTDKGQYGMLPPSFAKFSLEEPDIIVYTGYGAQRCLQFHSMTQKKVVRTAALTHWATCLDLAASSPLTVVGSNERLLKLLDYYEGSFQDFVGHGDVVSVAKFSPDGTFLFTASHSEIFIWEVVL